MGLHDNGMGVRGVAIPLFLQQGSAISASPDSHQYPHQALQLAAPSPQPNTLNKLPQNSGSVLVFYMFVEINVSIRVNER